MDFYCILVLLSLLLNSEYNQIQPHSALRYRSPAPKAMMSLEIDQDKFNENPFLFLEEWITKLVLGNQNNRLLAYDNDLRSGITTGGRSVEQDDDVVTIR